MEIFLILLVVVAAILILLGGKKKDGAGLLISGVIILVAALLIIIITGTAIRLGNILFYGVIILAVLLFLRAKIKGSKESKENEIKSSLFREALKYNEGKDGVQQDQNKAYELFCKAAEKGEKEAYYYVGYYLEHGLGGNKKDIEKSFEYYEKFIDIQEHSIIKTDHHNEIAYKLGKSYRFGIGINEDPKKAVKYLAQTVDEDGIYLYARCFEDGYGVEKSLNRARRLYESVGYLGNADLRYRLGRLYINGGEGIAIIPQRALYWLNSAKCRDKKLVDRCDIEIRKAEKMLNEEEKSEEKEAVKRILTLLTQELEDYKKDIVINTDSYGKYFWNEASKYNENKETKNVVNMVLFAAIEGYARAQVVAGHIYENGIEIEQNNGMAAYWYKSAVDQDYVDNVMNGYYVLREYYPESAEKMLQLGLQNEFSAAYALLGDLYYYGIADKEEDKAKALSWYEKAAQKENSYAIYQIGQIYRKGEGIEKDPKYAETMYQRSAQYGDPRGCYAYGHILVEKGLKESNKDYFKEGIINILTSAEENYPIAMCSMGLIYEKIGNKELAYSYYEKAASLDNEYAEGKMLAKYMKENDEKKIIESLEKLSHFGNIYAKKELLKRVAPKEEILSNYSKASGSEQVKIAEQIKSKLLKASLLLEDICSIEEDKNERKKYLDKLHKYDEMLYWNEQMLGTAIGLEELEREIEEDNTRRKQEALEREKKGEAEFWEGINNLSLLGLNDIALEKIAERYRDSIRKDPILWKMLEDVNPNTWFSLNIGDF